MKRDYHTTFLLQDEHSVSSECSTIAVVSASKDEEEPEEANVMIRRRVHFDETCNVYYTQQDDDDESNTTWYTETDMKQFKAETYGMAREIHQLEHEMQDPTSYSTVLATAYDACRRAPCETTASPLTPRQGQCLRKWMRAGISRWGLERICIRPIAADRRSRRGHAVHAVLELQDMLGFRDDCAAVIAKTAEIWSRPSRLFARELATAQAAAL